MPPKRPAKSTRSSSPKKAGGAKRTPASKSARAAKPAARAKQAKPTKRGKGQPPAAAQAMALPTPEQIAATIAEAQRQVMAAAMESMRPDPGTVTFLSAFAKTGEHVVAAAVADRQGRAIFSTAGTRWNVHGIESFENGTSLFLHHLDHPSLEQRIIIWPPPPANGTFESFGESMPLAELRRELDRRDQALAAKPEEQFKPADGYATASTFIGKTYYTPPPDRDGTPAPFDPERFEIDAEPAEDPERGLSAELVIFDKKIEQRIFDLTGSGWDAQVKVDGGGKLVHATLRPRGESRRSIGITIDLEHFAISVPGEPGTLPLDWVERHLRNYALYGRWDVFVAALKSGPVPEDSPEVMLAAPEGWTVELWPGDRRHALPFMQPRIVDPAGRAVLDARGSQWAAAVEVDAKRPVVTLRLVSSDIAEREDRFAGGAHPIRLDLASRRVTVEGMDGSTTVGRVHEMLHRVRGVKWLLEELTEMTAKGRLIPLPRPTGTT